MTHRPQYVYGNDEDQLAAPVPGMTLCAKVYRTERATGPGDSRVTLAAVGADVEAVGYSFLAGAGAFGRFGAVPPDVAACLKVATDWLIGAMTGTAPGAASPPQ